MLPLPRAGPRNPWVERVVIPTVIHPRLAWQQAVQMPAHVAPVAARRVAEESRAARARRAALAALSAARVGLLEDGPGVDLDQGPGAGGEIERVRAEAHAAWEAEEVAAVHAHACGTHHTHKSARHCSIARVRAHIVQSVCRGVEAQKHTQQSDETHHGKSTVE